MASSKALTRLWFAVATIVGAAVGADAAGLEPLQIVTAGGPHTFQVEIAGDEASRERGLMFRRFMPAQRNRRPP